MTIDRPSSRRAFLRRGGLTAAASPFLGFARDSQERSQDLNVLLILVADLRTELGCFGSARARTPAIDRIAAKGMTFLRNYCQQAASTPSRTSLLTGLRPDSTRVVDERVHFRRAEPNALTIPEYFREHGYATTAFGKVFDRPEIDDLQSWSVPPWSPSDPSWGSDANKARAQSHWTNLRNNRWLVNGEPPASSSGPCWQSVDVRDEDLDDGKVARAAAAAIDEMSGDRFFIATGFTRPSLPLIAPARYFDLTPKGSWGLSDYSAPPRDAPSFALHGSSEIRAFEDVPESGPLPEPLAREVIRAYRASLTFCDAQVGVLLDALDRNGVADSTVVVLMGVSGAHLGELGLWTKHSNYESATHTPLVVRAPGQRNAGRKTSVLVESVDLFPSLCSLCRLPRPASLEGSNWRLLFDDPKRLWKRAAYSQHPREIPGIGPGMGYSMRTNRHRYTEWSALDSPYATTELYDYKNAPVEWRNLANRPDAVSLVNGLAHMYREGWQGSRPPSELPMSSRA